MLFPGVGATDDQHALTLFQFDVLGMGFFASLFVRLEKERVVRREEVKPRALGNLWQAPVQTIAKPGARGDPVEFRQPALMPLDLGQVAPDVARQFAENRPNFLAFVVPKQLHLVVQGNARARLDEGHRPGVGAAEHGATDLTLVAADDSEGTALLDKPFLDVGELPFS